MPLWSICDILHNWFALFASALSLFAAGVPAAQLRLGVMYENGIGVKTNFKVGCTCCDKHTNTEP